MKITTITTTQQQCKGLRKTPKSGVQRRGYFLASEEKRKYRKSERKENLDQQVKKSKLQTINGPAFYKEKIDREGTKQTVQSWEGLAAPGSSACRRQVEMTLYCKVRFCHNKIPLQDLNYSDKRHVDFLAEWRAHIPSGVSFMKSPDTITRALLGLGYCSPAAWCPASMHWASAPFLVWETATKQDLCLIGWDRAQNQKPKSYQQRNSNAGNTKTQSQPQRKWVPG